ncbi:hypothetical protein [Zavarzinella formosa]|uniref:hypothetical protein n=1 Tax=Zavarzinella formosa TaxID=360055 RepID=UPI000302365B|nr:hypothetical protein [Zavarzinella formosa]
MGPVMARRNPAHVVIWVIRAGFSSWLPALTAVILVGLFPSADVARAQEPKDQPLILQGLTPTGGRASVTESCGTLQFTVVNPNVTGRDARVVVFYPEKPDVQYARDVWIPGRASVSTWLTVGPAPGQKSENSREFQAVLHDRTGGVDRIVLPPGEERIRSRGVLYRRREQATALMADVEAFEPGVPAELLALARLPRAGSLSEHINIVHDGPLPLSAEALDGVDVFILAGNRLAADPPGRAALRRWVEQGGRLWVMLDKVDSEVAAPILGDDFEIGVVDRVGLTTIPLHGPPDGPKPDPPQEVEQPVAFVRVVPSASDRVFATVDGWPAAFTRRVGRGKVLFTTLGSRGWSRPRPAQDKKSPFSAIPEFPIPLGPVTFLSLELHPPAEADPHPPEIFQAMLVEDIGYAVIGRGTVALILGGFVIALIGLTISLRRRRRSELLGGLAPFAAGIAAVIFVGLSDISRQAVPPTVGLAALVDPVPGSEESVVSGLYAVYHPSSGPMAVGTNQGAMLGLDAEGLGGQTRMRVESDTDSWRWEGLQLPAGTRTGSFRTTIKTGRIAAAARFGPNGVEGKLTHGPFRDVTDAIILPRIREPLAVRFGTEGQFASGTSDALPASQYLAGSVLTDRQQRRQAVYRRLLDGPAPRHPDGRDFLWTWADTSEVPIIREEGARIVGSVLLVVPLEYERTPPETKVVIPRGMVPYTRQTEDGKQLPVTMSAQFPADMRLRFQIPASVLPFQVERVTFFAQARIPSRRFSVTGGKGAKPIPLLEADSANEPIRIDITDASVLRLDEQGCLYLNLEISATSSGVADNTPWKIESLAIEVTGKTGATP